MIYCRLSIHIHQVELCMLSEHEQFKIAMNKSRRKRSRFTRRAWQMSIKPSQKAGIMVAGRQWSKIGSQKQTIPHKHTNIQTELNRELMRPGEKQTQVKSMNKNERQGYLQEHIETGLRSRTQRNRASFQNTKKQPFCCIYLSVVCNVAPL